MNTYIYMYVCRAVLLGFIELSVTSLHVCRDSVRDRMKRDYLSDPLYTFENANHASKACGPLVQWAIAQVML